MPFYTVGNSPKGLVNTGFSSVPVFVYTYKAAKASTSDAASIWAHIEFAFVLTAALLVVIELGTDVPPSAARITIQSVGASMPPAWLLITSFFKVFKPFTKFSPEPLSSNDFAVAVP